MTITTPIANPVSNRVRPYTDVYGIICYTYYITKPPVLQEITKIKKEERRNELTLRIEYQSMKEELGLK